MTDTKAREDITAEDDDDSSSALMIVASVDTHKDCCGLCDEPVNASSEWFIQSPCCGNKYHVVCMEGSMFLPSRKTIHCPQCTDPGVNRDVVLAKLKHTYGSLLSKGTESWESTWSEKLELVKRHIMRKMKRKETRGAFEKEWTTWMSTGVTMSNVVPTVATNAPKSRVQFLLDQKPSIRFDTLESLGWTITDVYHGVTKSWKELCRLGFSISHMTTDERNIVPLVLLYRVNIDLMRCDLGSHSVSIKKIKDLSAESLSALGYTTHTLCRMGLTKSRIPTFKKLSMYDWINALNFRPVHIELMNIREEDFGTILNQCKWNAIALNSAMEKIIKKDHHNMSPTTMPSTTLIKSRQYSKRQNSRHKQRSQRRYSNDRQTSKRGGGRSNTRKYSRRTTLEDYMEDYGGDLEPVDVSRLVGGKQHSHPPPIFQDRPINASSRPFRPSQRQQHEVYYHHDGPTGIFSPSGLYIPYHPKNFFGHVQHHPRSEHHYYRKDGNKTLVPTSGNSGVVTAHEKKQPFPVPSNKGGKSASSGQRGVIRVPTIHSKDKKKTKGTKLSDATFEPRAPCFDHPTVTKDDGS